jgi:hypothetical protein
MRALYVNPDFGTMGVHRAKKTIWHVAKHRRPLSLSLSLFLCLCVSFKPLHGANVYELASLPCRAGKMDSIIISPIAKKVVRDGRNS